MNPLQEELKKYDLPMVDVDQYIKDPLFKVKITVEGMDNWSWYICQWDQDTYLFGYVIGIYPELGYFDMGEIIISAQYDFSRIKVEPVNVKLSELQS